MPTGGCGVNVDRPNAVIAEASPCVGGGGDGDDNTRYSAMEDMFDEKSEASQDSRQSCS